jgi:aerobic-type carbon monoxide dehydrogenase small subunit (CoxS/CutS family)
VTDEAAGTFDFDGEAIAVRRGVTLAAALWESGRRSWRVTERGHMARGYYCGDGVCYDCLVTVDGQSNVRACLTAAEPGMRVATQVGFGEPWP